MKRLSIILVILSGCAAEPVPDAPVSFRGVRARSRASEAAVEEFHYLTYDYTLGSWVGELGGHAVADNGSPGIFLPSDASRVYWPEGKTYSFYAAAYNANEDVDENDVEFGTAMMIYSSGTNAILNIRNPGHNVDWLAAKVIRQEKIDGIPLVFRHICAKISRLHFDLAAYREWIENRELDLTGINVVWCTLTDVNEQTFIYSSSAETMFNREGWNYVSSPALPLASDELPFYAFPGRHTLALRVQTVDASGNQRIDDRVLSGEVELAMGADCELNIRINPYDRDLTIEVVSGIAAWQSGESGTVNE